MCSFERDVATLTSFVGFKSKVRSLRRGLTYELTTVKYGHLSTVTSEYTIYRPHSSSRNTSNVKNFSMPKRKNSDGGQSDMADEHQVSRPAPVTLVIDPEGDLYMKLDVGSLQVPAKLSLSAPQSFSPCSGRTRSSKRQQIGLSTMIVFKLFHSKMTSLTP